MILLFLACTGAEETPAASDDTTDTPTDTLEDTDECVPLGALFFDLGDTLVSEGDDGLHAATPEALALLDALSKRDWPLGVITNVPAGWERSDLEALLADPSILDQFEVVMLSSQATQPKPDPIIFTEALALLADPPDIAHVAFITEEATHLADADPPTQGAQAAGMIGIHLSTEGGTLADYTLAPDAMASLADAPWLDCLE
ncbi:MAG: FMN phosphatase YigB (HAD superfamily) [Myxococcota bacterium]|jgi:FMN phosphatase YigB (HAD superfamily)